MDIHRRTPVALLVGLVALAGLSACGDSPSDPGGDGDPDDPPDPSVSHGLVTVLASEQAPGRNTSDLWVHGDHAYTGTWHQTPEVDQPGNAMFVWSLADPADPQLVDSLVVDAAVVNDVKISPDGSLGVLTREGPRDGQNGITFFDLSDPASPDTVRHYAENLEAGVHNVWLENDFVYVVTDGRDAESGGLRILDIAEPSAPVEVAHYYAGSSNLHDVYVRDGLAFLSHWDAGLVILDVGDGIVGGSPGDPQVVSHLEDLGGDTHNAWYWPEGDYVFVGEEDFGTPPGIMRVVDASDLENPEVVATYGVPGDTPHNFWLDEDREILYLAWYTRGIRALDVSGELSGELREQGRELSAAVYGPEEGWCHGGGGTCTWAPQLHEGRLYMSDIVQGLVVATPAH